MSKQTKTKKTQRYYWLALNGPSVAACGVPMSKNLIVTPTPEQLIGYSTFEEMKKSQQFLLTAPIEKVAEYMETLPPRIRAGEVQYQRPRHPAPYNEDATMWHDGPALVA